MREQEDSLVQRMAHKGAWLAGWAVASGMAAIGFANHSEAETTLGAHTVSVSPTWDGYATLEGYEATALRYPLDTPLHTGVHITLEHTPQPETAIQRDSLIAAHPEGEITNLRNVTENLLLQSLGKGALLGSIAIGSAYFLAQRRKVHFEHLSSPDSSPSRIMAYMVLGGSIAIGGSNLLTWPDASSERNWVQLTDQVPELQKLGDVRINQVEMAENDASTGVTRLINSTIDSYKAARVYYEDIEKRVPVIAPLLRQPGEDETVAILLSDRHDNILMDSVARAIGDAGGATVVIDAGDDTSSGADWEAFSLNSLNESFKQYKYRIAIPGNHDEGQFVGKQLKDMGWHILNGEPQTINAIRFLGDKDPRSSGLGNWKDDVDGTLQDQNAMMATIACEAGSIDTLVTHSPYAAQDAVSGGCVRLALSGHLHVQQGPDTQRAANGASSTTYTNGTTGGAAYAFALGTKLRRDAEVTLITYKNGVSIGLQPVMIRTTGEIEPESYIALPSVEEQAAAQKQPINRKSGVQ